MIKQTKVQLNSMTGATTNLTKAQIQNAQALKAQAQAEAAQQKAQQETIKTSNLKEKQLKAEQKATADAANEYKQLSLAYNEAALRAKNLQIVAPNSDAAKQATKEAAELGAYLKQLDESVGQHQRNVGNYSSALTGYANVLRGMRGPVKLLGEAFGIGAMEADQLRLVIEHSLQALSAWYKGKTATTAATEADTAAQAENIVAQEATTAATSEATVAMEAEAVAATEAAAATGVSWAVILPFVAVLALLAAPILLAVDAIKHWVNADKELVEAQGELAASLEKVQNLQKEGLETLKAHNEMQNKALQDEIAYAKASGKSKEELAALEARLAIQQLSQSESLRQRYAVDAQTVEDALKKQQNAILRVSGIQKEIAENDRVEVENAGKSALVRKATLDKEKLEAELKEAENSKKLATSNYQFQKENLDDSFNAQKSATEKGIEIERIAAETAAKIEAQR
jgi:hypothetical protein